MVTTPSPFGVFKFFTGAPTFFPFDDPRGADPTREFLFTAKPFTLSQLPAIEQRLEAILAERATILRGRSISRGADTNKILEEIRPLREIISLLKGIIPETNDWKNRLTPLGVKQPGETFAGIPTSEIKQVNIIATRD